MEMCFGGPGQTAAIDLAGDRTPDMKIGLGIVAANRQEATPIFEIADFVWLKDLCTAFPKFEATLARHAR